MNWWLVHTLSVVNWRSIQGCTNNDRGHYATMLGNIMLSWWLTDGSLILIDQPLWFKAEKSSSRPWDMSSSAMAEFSDPSSCPSFPVLRCGWPLRNQVPICTSSSWSMKKITNVSDCIPWLTGSWWFYRMPNYAQVITIYTHPVRITRFLNNTLVSLKQARAPCNERILPVGKQTGQRKINTII